MANAEDRALRAARALDLTHAVAGRGPKTVEARRTVSTWLDLRTGRFPGAAVTWLLGVARKEHTTSSGE